MEKNRAGALKLLAMLWPGHPNTLQPILDQLGQPSTKVRKAALYALEPFGKGARTLPA